MATAPSELKVSCERFFKPSTGLVLVLTVQAEERATTETFVDEEGSVARVCGRIAATMGIDAGTLRERVDAILAESRDWPEGRRQASPSGGADFLANVLGSKELAEGDFPRSWLVESLFLENAPIIIGGPRKSLKTTILIDLAISLATGTPFLGQYAVPRPVRVAIFSGESGEAAIQDAARRISAARQKELSSDRNIVWGFNLPRLGRDDDIARLADFLGQNQIKVAIVDPLYLCLMEGGEGISPTNLFSMGPRLRRVSAACLDAGATPILVHHAAKTAAARKARKGEPLDLDDLSFAGVPEFARQWMLISRRDEYRSGRHSLWLVVGGSAGHDHLLCVDVDEGTLQADGRGRGWHVVVCTENGSRERLAKPRAGKRSRHKQEKVQDALLKLEECLRSSPAGETERGLVEKTGIGKAVVTVALNQLRDAGKIVPVKVRKRAGRGNVPHDAWKLARANESGSASHEGGGLTPATKPAAPPDVVIESEAESSLPNIAADEARDDGICEGPPS